MFIVRGVQLWFGLSDEERGECALRPVRRFCGLEIGSDLREGWDNLGGELRESFPRPRLVSVREGPLDMSDASNHGLEVREVDDVSPHRGLR